MGNDKIGYREQPMAERHESNGRMLSTAVTLLVEQVMLTPRLRQISRNKEDHSLLLASICSEHKEISLTTLIGFGFSII